MHKIYFEKRVIIILSPKDQALEDPNTIQFNIGEDFDLGDLVEMFEATENLKKVYIATPEIDKTYSKICSKFLEVNAGGGLVRNRRGDFLLINRNSLWDLPKGHQEIGEEINITAHREVQEETGINELDLEDLICITDHCYIRNGLWHLKHTYWFNMLYTGPIDLCPQIEEDITKAAWVAKSSLALLLKDTYPSIMEVFREAKI